MMDKPQLQIKPWKLGEAFVYRCSVCGQEFIAPEDRRPEEGMTEVSGGFLRTHPGMSRRWGQRGQVPPLGEMDKKMDSGLVEYPIGQKTTRTTNT